MKLYEISTDFYSVECNETTADRFSTKIIPLFISHIKDHRLSEINNVKIASYGRYYSVVFLDEKMKQRYFKLVKKIVSNHIDHEIARRKSRKMLIQNSEAK